MRGLGDTHYSKVAFIQRQYYANLLGGRTIIVLFREVSLLEGSLFGGCTEYCHSVYHGSFHILVLACISLYLAAVAMSSN